VQTFLMSLRIRRILLCTSWHWHRLVSTAATSADRFLIKRFNTIFGEEGEKGAGLLRERRRKD